MGELVGITTEGMGSGGRKRGWGLGLSFQCGRETTGLTDTVKNYVELLRLYPSHDQFRVLRHTHVVVISKQECTWANAMAHHPSSCSTYLGLLDYLRNVETRHVLDDDDSSHHLLV